MKKNIFFLFFFCSLKAFSQTSKPYEPLIFKNYSPIWSHYSKVASFSDTLQNYLLQQVKISSDKKSAYLLHNVADRYFFQGFLLEKINMLDGNTLWQDYAFSKEKGERKYADNIVIDNNQVTLAIFKENQPSGPMGNPSWSKSILQSYNYNELNGNKTDSVITNPLDKNNALLNLPTVGGFLRASKTYLFANIDTTYDYILQSGFAKSIVLTKKKLDKAGHKLDSIQVTIPIAYNPESARLVKKSDGSFFLFVSTQNPNISSEREVKLSFFDKNMNLISSVDISDKFTEKVSGMTYYDDEFFIVNSSYNVTEDSILKSNLTYSLFKYDGTLLESITNVNNYDEVKGFSIAKLRNQIGMVLIKALSQNNKTSIHIMKSDGKNALQTLKTLEIASNNLEIVALRNIKPTEDGDILVSFSYAHKENLKKTYAEKWANFTLFSGKELGLITTAQELKEATSFKIFPNPASDQLNIQYTNNQSDINFEINISDLSGRVLLKTTLSENDKTIDISRFQNGFYVVTILENNRLLARQRFVKVE